MTFLAITTILKCFLCFLLFNDVIHWKIHIQQFWKSVWRTKQIYVRFSQIPYCRQWMFYFRRNIRTNKLVLCNWKGSRTITKTLSGFDSIRSGDNNIDSDTWSARKLPYCGHCLALIYLNIVYYVIVIRSFCPHRVLLARHLQKFNMIKFWAFSFFVLLILAFIGYLAFDSFRW